MVVFPEVGLEIRQTFHSSMLVVVVAGPRIVLRYFIIDNIDALIKHLIEVE